jgi:two-component system, OmpR family, response regulator VicR
MEVKPKLLIVEDDPNLGQILREYLEVKGYEPTLCTDGEAGFTTFARNSFDMCILDVMMPKKDGFTLAREIREKSKTVPIIFLTAKSMKDDTIEGLKIGADDYLTKPFSMEELLLRMKAIFRRTHVHGNGEETNLQFEIGSLYFDAHLNLLKSPRQEIKLTSKENALLLLFCQNLNKTVDRAEALMKIWHDDSYFNARSMDVYIAKLRKYLKEDERLKILTVHGQGFKLVELK